MRAARARARAAAAAIARRLVVRQMGARRRKLNKRLRAGDVLRDGEKVDVEGERQETSSGLERHYALQQQQQNTDTATWTVPLPLKVAFFACACIVAAILLRYELSEGTS
jgi:hypothetical protein